MHRPITARRWPWIATGVLCGALSLSGAEPDAEDSPYEIGGPLAGLKLPPYRTHHGEAAGHPGDSFGPPQVDLYPGSVEQWRAYWFKYCPVRSMFDRQSLVTNWAAPAIPGAPKAAERYAQPVWKVHAHGDHKPTGQFEPPIDVVRIKAGDTILSADLGELPQGVYCLRIIAAVPADISADDFRKNLFVVLAVNDKLDGGDSTYRVRIGYCDQFYSVAELYFHAVEQRRFRATLRMDPASDAPLLVRNVTLDNALAGVQRGAHKKKANDPFPAEWIQRIKDAEAKRATDPVAMDKRLKRDALIWQNYPHVNRRFAHILDSTQGGMRLRAPNTVKGMAEPAIAEHFGVWTLPAPEWEFPHSRHPDVFLRNEKLNLNYTFADLQAGRPLPDPFPFKDDGNGVVTGNPDGATGTAWTPIASAVQAWVGRTHSRASDGLRVFPPNPGQPADRDADTLRDGLIAFLRFTYDLPTYDPIQDLGTIVCQKGGFGRSLYDRQRETFASYYSWYTEYANFAELYDKYYDFIQSNQSLADSLHRFLPWIKTPQDVIDLCDAYLVQITTRRILRYHTYVFPDAALRMATLLGEPRITQPWMEWMFSRTFVYPLKLMGMQHLMASAYDHSGIEFGRSTFYGIGENAANLVDATEKYAAATGDRTFSMNDPERYPKGRAALYWPLAMYCSGWQAPRIGDVTGPDKGPESFLNNSESLLRKGWNHTRDPRFAAILVHMGWTRGYTGKQLDELRTAATQVKRMPWFENESRMVPNWAGVLEGGTQHNDIRFRRSAMVRTGWGSGHHHADSLDLQLCAFGLPMLVDAGQRPGYTAPASGLSAVHNVVTVTPAGQPMQGNHVNAWVRGLLHTPEMAYLHAHSGEPVNLNRGARQVALVSVDEGRGAQDLPIEQQKPGIKLDPQVTLPKSYIFDVVRTAGAGVHRYNFHAMVNDQFEWNASDVKQAPEAFDGAFKASQDRSFIGKAPDCFQATWRLRRETTDQERISGTEQQFLGINYDPASPAKYVRLHLPGLQDAAVHRGELITHNPPCPVVYHFTCIGLERKVADVGSCFVALIEPYAGEPFIQSAALLQIAGNSEDARQAVAVGVQTTTGNRDLLLADGASGVIRRLKASAARFAAEYAWQSVDAQGLRTAGLMAGTLLATPEVRIHCVVPEFVGRISRVDYAKQQVEVTGGWPAQSRPVLAEIGPPGRKVSVTVKSAQPMGSGRTLLTLAEGAQRLLTKAEVQEKTHEVMPVAGLLPDPLPSEEKDWTISNADLSKVWKADKGGQGFLVRTPITAQDLGPESDLCVWDYGLGDRVRQASSVVLRRIQPGVYEITANADATLELPGSAGEIKAADGSETPLRAVSGWIEVRLKAGSMAEGPVVVRVK